MAKSLPKSRNYSAEERNEALATLRGWLKPGDTVYTILRHCSASGMSRRITLCIIRLAKKGDADKAPYVLYLDGNAEKVLDHARPAKGDGIKVGGCGMDMGYHLVYGLSRALFPDGFKVKGTGRNGDTSGHDNDGGYALRHRWL